MSLQRPKILRTILIVVTVLGAVACARELIRSRLHFSPPEARWVRATLSRLTLEEKIGQMIGLRYQGRFLNRDSEALQDLQEWVVDYHIGGFIQVQGGVYETARLTNRLQKLADIPLLIAADLERGLGNQIRGATLFPPIMSIGATGSEELAYAMGRITAVEARAVGIHMTYAPVVDVNNNPDNPIINVRSFGEDPLEVGRLGAAFIRGCQEHGLIATAKHFPGHGDTAVDSHSALPVITADRERLERLELYPFRAAIRAGVLAVMSAHLQLPALDPTPHLPATLSRPILTDLLRGELGFQGLLVTDALEMAGIADLYAPGEAAARAVQAGADMLLLPPDTREVIQTLVEAVERGEISYGRINSAVRRILEVKARLGLHRRRLVDPTDLDSRVGAKPHQLTARQAVEASLTLVQHRSGVLPLSMERERIAVFSLSSDAGGYFAGRTFAEEVRKRSPEAMLFYADAVTGERYLRDAVKASRGADIRIVALFSRLAASKGRLGLAPRLVRMVRAFTKSRNPVVVISFNSPYLLRRFPEVDAYICAFRHSDPIQKAAARALFGEIGLTGRLPVSIPGLYPVGHGIRLSGE